MRKNMTEAMEAKVRKFAEELILHWSEQANRTTTYDSDQADNGKYAIENWPEDPDAELMEEITELLKQVDMHTEAPYWICTDDNRHWGILTRCHNGLLSIGGGGFSLQRIRDKLQKMLPPPVPTLEEAAEAAKEVETLYRLSSRVRPGSHTEKKFQSVARFFEAEINRQAEKEGDDGA